jgi:hypothetical protein
MDRIQRFKEMKAKVLGCFPCQGLRVHPWDISKEAEKLGISKSDVDSAILHLAEVGSIFITEDGMVGRTPR